MDRVDEMYEIAMFGRTWEIWPLASTARRVSRTQLRSFGFVLWTNGDDELMNWDDEWTRVAWMAKGGLVGSWSAMLG